MRSLRLFGVITATVLLFGLAIIFSLPLVAADLGTSWDKPITIDVQTKQFTDYRQLRGTGDAVYYRLTVDHPTAAHFQVTIPQTTASHFAPQVVLFLPYSTTVGPLLPVVQPPLTMARVYPMTQPKELFDVFTQTALTQRLEADPDFPTAGTYTFAIYDAGQAGGQFRFTLSQGSVTTASWRDVWHWPVDWWQGQAFAGFSWLTIITPVLIALSLWFVYLRLDHHQLHPHKAYIRKKPKAH